MPFLGMPLPDHTVVVALAFSSDDGGMFVLASVTSGCFQAYHSSRCRYQYYPHQEDDSV
jgi:hypothetical protein